MVLNFMMAAVLTLAPPAVSRHELDNGVRVLIVHAPEAPKQTTLTFLPRSLVNDPAGKTQWSHLLEHMLIRSTDPLTLFPEGMSLNGETGPDYLRLDSIAEVDRWRASIERHGKWLRARRFDPETLAREKQVIEQEERATASTGQTHKWALAAWNQAIRHGRAHAAVHSDVAEATVEEVRDFAEASVRIDGSILVATIGPLEPGDVLAALEATIGGAKEDEPPRDAGGAEAVQDADAPQRPQASAPRFEGGHRATWDLPTRHLLVWWKLPAAWSADEHAAAETFGTMLAMQLMQQFPVQPGNDAEGGGARVRPAVHANVRTPEGTFLIVNLSFAGDVDPEVLKTAVVSRAARLGGSPTSIARAGAFLAQNMALPDLAPLRRNRPAGPNADLLEGNLLVALAAKEFAFREGFDDVAARFRSIDEATAGKVAELFSGPPTGTLVVAPRRDD